MTGEHINLKSHSISLKDRNGLSITGVTEVIGFDEYAVFLVTDYGALNIEGIDLHIEKLNLETGDLFISGEVTSLTYKNEDKQKNKKLLSRLFS